MTANKDIADIARQRVGLYAVIWDKSLRIPIRLRLWERNYPKATFHLRLKAAARQGETV